MAEVTIRQFVWTMLSLFTLSFWINLSILIEWSTLVENNDAENVNRCNHQQKNLCRYRYPIIRGPRDFSITAGPDWNTTAVGDDADSFGRCRCDVECGRYGDCCADAADVYDIESRSSLTSQWTCLPMRTERDRYRSDQNFHMYMIGSCPISDLSSNDKSVEALCRRRKDPESYHEHQYSYLIDIPVLSLATNRTYANVYCAQCHFDSHQLAQWNISIKCDDDIEKYNLTRDRMFRQENYRPGKRSWIYNQEHLTLKCIFIIEQFNNPINYLKSTAGRHCVSGSHNCASDWTGTAEGHNCDIYTLYVETPAVEVPKNSHCVDNTLYSFSIVMDFKFGGNQVGKTCQSNEIFDHLQKSCHAVTCDSQMLKHASGICVGRQQLAESVNNVSLGSRCSRLTLFKHVDYYSLDNGSLVLNKTGEILQPNDYESSRNGTVQICESESFPRFLNELKNYLKDSYAQRCLSNVCLTISVICLAFHIAIHIALPKLRNVPAKNLLALSCTLFLGQLLFLTGVGARNSIGYGPCALIAVLIHWSLMAAFFWMNIMGFDMCRTFAGSQIKPRLQHASVTRRRTTFRSYSLYGWSCPSLIVVVALIVDFCGVTDSGWAPHYGTHQCWICNKNGLGLFFVLPMAVLLTVNLVFFILTAWSIVKQWRETHFAIRQSRTFKQKKGIANFSDSLKMSDMIYQRNRKSYIVRLRTRFFLYVKLGTIMGLGWVSGFIAALADVPGLWYPFILFNTLQGTFIFLAFDCKRKVYYMVYEVITKRPHPSNLSSSQRVSTTPTTASTKLQATRKISLLTPPVVSNNQM